MLTEEWMSVCVVRSWYREIFTLEPFSTLNSNPESCVKYWSHLINVSFSRWEALPGQGLCQSDSSVSPQTPPSTGAGGCVIDIDGGKF